MWTKTISFAAAIAISASSAFAGGLSPEIVESTQTEDEMAAAPSINPTYIVVGVLAALLIAAAVNDGDDDEEEPAAPPPVMLR